MLTRFLFFNLQICGSRNTRQFQLQRDIQGACRAGARPMSRCTWAARALGVSIRCGDRPGKAWALLAVGGADDSRASVGGERKRKQAALGRTHKQTSAGRDNGADAGTTGAAGAAAGAIAATSSFSSSFYPGSSLSCPRSSLYYFPRLALIPSLAFFLSLLLSHVTTNPRPL